MKEATTRREQTSIQSPFSLLICFRYAHTPKGKKDTFDPPTRFLRRPIPEHHL